METLPLYHLAYRMDYSNKTSNAYFYSILDAGHIFQVLKETGRASEITVTSPTGEIEHTYTTNPKTGVETITEIDQCSIPDCTSQDCHKR